MGPLRNFELKQHKFTTTYVKLQEAYASENNAVGTWAQIGYKDPGAGNGHKTTNFDYSSQAEAADGKWVASNRVALNDCNANNTWTLETAYTSCHLYTSQSPRD